MSTMHITAPNPEMGYHGHNLLTDTDFRLGTTLQPLTQVTRRSKEQFKIRDRAFPARIYVGTDKQLWAVFRDCSALPVQPEDIKPL